MRRNTAPRLYMNALSQGVVTLRAALENASSSFYRDFYTTDVLSSLPNPCTKEAWEHIPLLSKENVMGRPLSERLFVPRERVESIRTTSGTTGAGLLAMPRLLHRVAGPPLLPNISTMMSFHYYSFMVQACIPERARIVAGDRLKLSESAVLAKEADADSLAGPASVLIVSARYLVKYGVNERIRTLLVLSERCSVIQWRLLRQSYPNALIYIEYGLSETGTVALCSEQNVPERGMPQKCVGGHILEITDNHGRGVEKGEAGEIVLTTVGEAAFPLVRYRTGDRATLLGESGTNTEFETMGRIQEDTVRIPGGAIKMLELERALSRLVHAEKIDFEAEVTEVIRDNITIPRLSVRIVVYDPSFRPNTNAIVSGLQNTLRVNQRRTYGDGVLAGLYEPLECSIVEAESTLAMNKRRYLRDARI